MIQIDNLGLYAASIATLEKFTSGPYLGRIVQIFLACKYYGAQIPLVGASQGIGVRAIQQMLDDLYEKQSRRPGPSVLMLFSNNHLYPTGVRGTGIRHASNIWRNNFNIQKGYGCYGSSAEINDPVFRNQSRTLCPHLQSPNAQLAGSTCSLDTSNDPARYRNEDHPKIFKIDIGSRDHFVYKTDDTSYYAPIVLASGGRRLPLGALIVALYYDSIIAAGRSKISLDDFLFDFNFTADEALVYFNDDPALPEHMALAAAFPAMFSWGRITPSPTSGLATAATGAVAPSALPAIPMARPTKTRAGSAVVVPTISPSVPPPAGGHWWDAEQAVRQALVNDGWSVVDVSRFRAGYDLHAYKNGTTRHVEVKSSAGACAPSLTENELITARRLRGDYVIAVVENFDPLSAVSILWIEDPASMHMSAKQQTIYSLPRSVWRPKAKDNII